jgi:glycosyltransferase involved in cell wall biosynthesis
MELTNASLLKLSPLRQLTTSIWNNDTYQKVLSHCYENKIDFVHIHNTFPSTSPAIYYAAKQAGALVVQWLHNYRLLCPAGTFFRNGRVCEDCTKHFVPWPSVIHHCYRNSIANSFGAASVLSVHRAFGSWQKKVDRFVALTDFTKIKFVENGFSPTRITVIPNHLHPDPGIGNHEGGYGIFVGRLSHEKGIMTLLSCLPALPAHFRLKIFGAGPLEAEVRAATHQFSGLTFCGQVPEQVVLSELGNARFLVFPSLWYEGLPRTIIEAFANGTPVIASNLGAMASLIDDGINGLHFNPGDANALTQAILRLTNDDRLWDRLHDGARQTYLANYTLEQTSNRIKLMMEGMLPLKRPDTNI